MIPAAIVFDLTRHCEERSDAAIQGQQNRTEGSWIATPQARLAMTDCFWNGQSTGP